MADQKPASAQDVIDTLKSIDAGIKALCAHFGALTAGQRATAQSATSIAGHAIQQIASDRDLDGQYGDPEVRYDPRDWTGDSFVGCPLSECSPEYLDVLAESLDSYAEWADGEGKTTSRGKPVGPYKRKDASRARGWAKRLRAGWKPPVREDEAFPSDAAAPLTDDDIPF